MMVYCKSFFKPKKKKKGRGVIAKKLDVSKLSGVDFPSYSYSSSNQHIKSHTTSTPFAPARRSVMDPMNLAKETPEVREAIIAKSKRLAPAYNKSGIQYISEETDLRTLGKKV